MSKAKAKRTVSPSLDEMTADAALRAILPAIAADIDRHIAGLMISDKAAVPHRARVALRRLRSVLAGFAPILERGVLQALKADAKAVFSMLGPLRDADVLALGAVDDAEAAERLAQATTLRHATRASLGLQGKPDFAGKIQAMFASDAYRRRGRKARKWRKGPIQPLAARALARAWQDGKNHGNNVQRMAEAERHAFRKDMKSLRYLSEVFAPLWPGKAQRRFIDRMEALQTALGTLNDIAVARGQLAPSEAAREAIDVAAAQAMRDADKAWRRLRKAGAWWPDQPD